MRISGFPRFIFIILLLITKTLSAQSTGSQDDITKRTAIQNALRVYQKMAGDAAPIFAGRQYEEYDNKIQEGYPFAIARNFMKGYVVFDGIVYEDLQLKFDLLIDKLLLPAPSGSFLIVPDMDKVSEFTLDKHLFVKLDRDPKNILPSGTHFYEILVEGNAKNLVLLKKENKSVAEETTGQGLKRLVVTSYSYYVKKGNAYYAFNKKGTVLDVLSDLKTEVRQFIRQQDLDFSDHKEDALIRIVTYYNSLNK